METFYVTEDEFAEIELAMAQAEAVSKKRTAEQMHITQPAATKILGDLEAMLGARAADTRVIEAAPAR